MQRIKLSQLTFTRFIAAIAIVIYHDKGSTFPFNGESFKQWMYYGNSLVSYFFILSGFILAITNFRGAATKIDKKKFYINRFARIYPLYLLALSTYVILGLSARTPIIQFHIVPFLLNIFLLQAWAPTYAYYYNYVGWSLSVEAFFYLIFPFLLQQLVRLSKRQLLSATLVIWLITQLVSIMILNANFSFSFTHCFPLLHLSSFFIGTTGGILFSDFQAHLANRKVLIGLLLVVVLGIVVALILSDNLFFHKYYHNGLLAPLFITLILFLSVLRGPFQFLLGSRPLIYLGEISYGVYILQAMVYVLVMGLNNRFFHLNSAAAFQMLLVTLLFISAITFEVVEKPARLFLRSFSNKPGSHLLTKNGQSDR